MGSVFIPVIGSDSDVAKKVKVVRPDVGAYHVAGVVILCQVGLNQLLWINLACTGGALGLLCALESWLSLALPLARPQWLLATSHFFFDEFDTSFRVECCSSNGGRASRAVHSPGISNVEEYFEEGGAGNSNYEGKTRSRHRKIYFQLPSTGASIYDVRKIFGILDPLVRIWY